VGEGVDFPHRPILATRLGVTVFIPWGLSHAPRRPETRLVPLSDSKEHLVGITGDWDQRITRRTLLKTGGSFAAGITIAGIASRPAELALLGGRLPEVPARIPELHFTTAQELLASAVGEHERGQPDLSPEGERWLGRWAMEEHGSELVFVTGYPMSKRPFYTHPDPERPGFSRGFDLLFRGLEIVTGGQRLHRYEDYVAALAERGLDEAPFAGYLEAFRFGMPPHGGFALGLERWTAQLTGCGNVREATLFPRDRTRLAP
jgi:nondiscriminating aspartyl-tRNA synthetase